MRLASLGGGRLNDAQASRSSCHHHESIWAHVRCETMLARFS